MAEEFSIVGDYYAKLTQKRFRMVDYLKTSSTSPNNPIQMDI